MVAVALVALVTSMTAAEPKKEKLDRGLVALKAQKGGIFVSWRLLGTEDGQKTTFDLLRDGKVIAADLSGATCYEDKEGTTNSRYQVKTKKGKKVVETSNTVTPWGDVFTTLKTQRPDFEVTLKGDTCRYNPGECAIGDVDGDGVMELVLKWNPDNAHDNSQRGYTGTVYLDCYKLDGTMLWRINMGKNIRAGEHYTQMMVYDFDGDGKAELMVKTAPGTKDGKGRYVSEAATDATIKSTDNNADYRTKQGLIKSGPEYLTVFNGLTGAAIHTVYYQPNRAGEVGTIADYPADKTFWGDDYANRSERYLACVAYLDGYDKNASAIFTRGYYTRAYLWAVDFDGKQIKTHWLHESPNGDEVWLTDRSGKRVNRKYDHHTAPHGNYGNTCFAEGAHNISVADVDGDGKDEIMFGSAAVDHDGWMLYSTGLGHGDAIHLGDFNPDRPGLEYYMVQEEPPYGWHLRDAATGELLAYDYGREDTGMGTMGHFFDERGDQFWSSDKDTIYDCTGKAYMYTDIRRLPHKHRLYWDGDLLDEMYYGGGIQKFVNKKRVNVLQFSQYNSIGRPGTKPHPIFFGDIMGDWRDEVIMCDKDDTSVLKIFSTNFPTEYRYPTLLHDHVYRMGMVWQNVAYNMPPHLSVYLPDAIKKYNK